MSETITFHNPTDKPVNCCSLLGADAPIVEPGADVEIPLELCAAKRLDNGSRGKSPIEKNCPQLTPKDPVIAMEWRKVPVPAPVASRVVTTAPRAANVPAGVLAAREAKAKAEASKPPAAKPPATTGKPAPVTAKPPAPAKPSTPAPTKPAEETAPPAAESEPEAKA